MNEPIAWWYNRDSGQSIWYQNPSDHGVSLDDAIPLYEGWEERLAEFRKTLGPNQEINCSENGTFYAIDLPSNPTYEVPEEPETPDGSEMWSGIADAVREGINSY